MAENDTKPDNSIPTVTEVPVTNVMPMTEPINADEITCSPAKKTKLDTERIIMGEELTGLEISFAQRLLKEQWHHINGL